MQHAFRPRKHALKLAIVALTAGYAVTSLAQSASVEEIQISARRRTETAQNVPIPVTVVSGELVADTGAFNVNRIKELIPSIQLYSSNPRNTAISIRGWHRCFGWSGFTGDVYRVKLLEPDVRRPLRPERARATLLDTGPARPLQVA